MGISFYYAVRILWRECGREFKTPTHINKKARRLLFGLSAVWTRLEPALRACLLATLILTTPPNLPLIGEA